MIHKIIFTLILISLVPACLGCEIHLPDHLLILGQSSNFKEALQQTDCTSTAIDEVSSLLNSIEGKVTSSQFAAILKMKNIEAQILPNTFRIDHISHLVREQLVLPPGVQLKSSEVVNGPNYLSLMPGDQIEIQCLGCLFGSRQPLNMKVISLDGNHRNLTVNADFKKMVKAFRTVGFLPAFSSVSLGHVHEEFVESIPQTDLVTSLEELKFYKLNKPLRGGELLKKSDLNAINLVRAGSKTDVVIENALIKLQTSGISRNNGGYGEFVEVFNPQKNKKYQGRVVDINKILVEL